MFHDIRDLSFVRLVILQTRMYSHTTGQIYASLKHVQSYNRPDICLFEACTAIQRARSMPLWSMYSHTTGQIYASLKHAQPYNGPDLCLFEACTAIQQARSMLLWSMYSHTSEQIYASLKHVQPQNGPDLYLFEVCTAIQWARTMPHWSMYSHTMDHIHASLKLPLDRCIVWANREGSGKCINWNCKYWTVSSFKFQIIHRLWM